MAITNQEIIRRSLRVRRGEAPGYGFYPGRKTEARAVDCGNTPKMYEQ